MSRPKKTILVVHADEAQRGIWKLILQVRGYRPLLASDASSALALHDLGVGLVLGFATADAIDWAALAERMKQRDASVPILLIGGRDCGAANVALCSARMNTFELMDRVKCLIARKRGPRKLELVPAAMAGD